jgi:hypothetical protein
VQVGTAIRAAGFALLGCLLLLAMLASSRASAEPASAPQGDAGERYFIEFRARPGPFIGHTYVVYGRTGMAGRVLDKHTAGLIPEGNPIVGAFLPVVGSVRQDKNDTRYAPNAVYRRSLSAAEYARVSRFVSMLRANEREWHLMFQNCNDFGIMVAEALGLRRPPSLMPPAMWVGLLRALNS